MNPVLCVWKADYCQMISVAYLLKGPTAQKKRLSSDTLMIKIYIGADFENEGKVGHVEQKALE